MAEDKNPTAGEPDIKNPNAGESYTPSDSREHAPSTDEDVATDFPTANTPDPKAANPELNPDAAGEKSTEVEPTDQVDKAAKKSAADRPAAKKAAKTEADAAGSEATEGDGEKPAAKKAAKPAGEKPAAAAKAKKEKAPAVEDKPFADFIQQDYLPALKKALESQGVQGLNLTFDNQKMPGVEASANSASWQVIGRWPEGRRQFSVAFPKEDIQGQKVFACSTSGSQPSTLEPFLIDERKVTLDLLVFGVVQRLNAQKWLTRN